VNCYDGLLAAVLAGDHGALSRLLTTIGEEPPDELIASIGRRVTQGGAALLAPVIVVTGAGGAGKSTLVGAVASGWATTATVGVLAIDPVDQRTGGAFLGDRIRIRPSGEGRSGARVFLRSMHSAADGGPLSDALGAAVVLMDLAGMAPIVVETAGSGQADAVICESVGGCLVFVTTPEGGDAIQGLKAGVQQRADVHVVNKADRPGASAARAALRTALRRPGRNVHLVEAQAGDTAELAGLRTEIAQVSAEKRVSRADFWRRYLSGLLRTRITRQLDLLSARDPDWQQACEQVARGALPFEDGLAMCLGLVADRSLGPDQRPDGRLTQAGGNAPA
jgi:putative protein kinase ArgK-like GTPase of G3E family